MKRERRSAYDYYWLCVKTPREEWGPLLEELEQLNTSYADWDALHRHADSTIAQVFLPLMKIAVAGMEKTAHTFEEWYGVLRRNLTEATRANALNHLAAFALTFEQWLRFCTNRDEAPSLRELAHRKLLEFEIPFDVLLDQYKQLYIGGCLRENLDKVYRQMLRTAAKRES